MTRVLIPHPAVKHETARTKTTHISVNATAAWGRFFVSWPAKAAIQATQAQWRADARLLDCPVGPGHDMG